MSDAQVIGYLVAGLQVLTLFVLGDLTRRVSRLEGMFMSGRKAEGD